MQRSRIVSTRWSSTPCRDGRARSSAGTWFSPGGFTEGEAQIRASLELAPGFHLARVMLAEALVGFGRVDEAAAITEQAMVGSGRATMIMAWHGRALALAGRRDEAETVEAELIARSSHEEVRPLSMATLAVALGRTNEAMTLVERASDMADNWIMYAAVDPRWDLLRASPRFHDVLRSLNLA